MADEQDLDSRQSEDRESSTTSSGKKSRRKQQILTPGQWLAGNYEVVEQIGEGGMAIVYKARQKSLNRMVAVKALHPKLAGDSEFISRFEAESGALAALSHPNIVAIIDRGNEEKVYFFVMEFVDGEDLDQKIIQNTLTPNDWRQVITSCADALEYVHKRNVVHRDIKPSNILVDSEGRVKIGDFGIAHIIAGDAAAGEEVGRNRTVGTQHYMAPEQSVDSGSVDHRADIYSLGVAFYKMMTRKMPVGDFAAPSEVNHDIPIAVDEVLFRAMALSPDDRYQTVRAFCDDLQKALRDQSVSITSILNYRGKTGASGASALYSGQDFSRTSSSAQVDTKRAKSDTNVRKQDTKTGTGTGTGTGSDPKRDSNSRRRKLGSDNVRASSDLTPLPLEGKGAAPGAAPPAKSNTLLIVGVLVLLLAGVGVIAAVVMMGSQEPPPSVAIVEPQEPEEVMSAARQREEMLRQRREERQRQIISGEDGSEMESQVSGEGVGQTDSDWPPVATPLATAAPTRPAPSQPEPAENDGPPAGSPFLN